MNFVMTPGDWIAGAQLLITFGVFPVLSYLGRITRRAQQIETRMNAIEIQMAAGFAELRAYHLVGTREQKS